MRILIIWDQRRDTQPKKILVTNRTTWETTRILLAYRKRWTGTETFHRDGKPQLGLGQCQLRSSQGQIRHMDLVFLAYTLLMCELRQNRAQEWPSNDRQPSAKPAASSCEKTCVPPWNGPSSKSQNMAKPPIA